MSELSTSEEIPPYETFASLILKDWPRIIEWVTKEFEPEHADLYGLQEKGMENVSSINHLAVDLALLMGEGSNFNARGTIYRSVAFAFVVAEFIAPQDFSLNVESYANEDGTLTERMCELKEDILGYFESAPAARGLLSTFAEYFYSSEHVNEFDLVAIPFGAVLMLTEESLHDSYNEKYQVS